GPCRRGSPRGAPRLRRFFFQAEDGIRAFHVTGVQTCALPIFLRAARPRSRCFSISASKPATSTESPRSVARSCVMSSGNPYVSRSEERRVGKECRSRGWAGAQQEDTGRRGHRAHAGGTVERVP